MKVQREKVESLTREVRTHSRRPKHLNLCHHPQLHVALHHGVLISPQLDDVSSSITKMKVQIKTGEKNTTKAAAASAEAAAELEEVSKEHEAARVELKKLEEGALVVQEDYKKSEQVM